MIKALLVLGFIALAVSQPATGTTGPTFLDGFSEKLGLTETEVDDANTCVQGIENLLMDLQDTLQTTDQEVEAIGNALLAYYKRVQSQLPEACQAFALDLVNALTKHIQPTEDGEMPNIQALIEANLETYFPQLVQQLGVLIDKLVNGQEYEAGKTVAYILQIVYGIEKPQAAQLASNVAGGSYVPFDAKKFIPKFFDSFFKTLGLKTVTSKPISSCWTLVQNLATANDKFVADAPKLDFFDTVERSAALYGKFVDTVKGCKDTFAIVDLTVGRIVRTVNRNQSKYLYQIFLNTITNFPAIEQTIQMEATYIFTGQYDVAGRIDALRLQSILKGVVNFATAEVIAQ
jgi:hypothetical protein